MVPRFFAHVMTLTGLARWKDGSGSREGPSSWDQLISPFRRWVDRKQVVHTEDSEWSLCSRIFKKQVMHRDNISLVDPCIYVRIFLSDSAVFYWAFVPPL